MLLRAITTSLLFLTASPVWASNYCKVSIPRGDREAIAEAFVDGERLQSVRIEDIVIPGKVTMDSAAKGYTVSGGGAAGLTPYRTGQSVEGKDWRERGSVATLFGGMTLHWPRFFKDGKPVSETLIGFNVEGLQQGITSMDIASSPDAQNLHVSWDARWVMHAPYSYRSQGFYTPKEIAFWPNVPAEGKSMRVDFFDRVVSRPIGSVTFNWPAEASWNSRMVEQVNALRDLYAAKKCTLAVTLDLDAAAEAEDDEEF